MSAFTPTAACLAAALLTACGGSRTSTRSDAADAPRARDAPPARDAPSTGDARGHLEAGDATRRDAAKDAAHEGCAPGLPPDTAINGVATPQISISGDTGSTLGISDLSVWYPSGAASGILAYSTVAFSAAGTMTVATRVATSVDNGKRWAFEANVNVASPLQVPCSGASLCVDASSCTLSGELIHEVPSVVIDATDPDPTRLYKVFVHSYVELPPASPGGDNQFELTIGYIGLYTAPAPGGPWSAETKVLGWNGPSSLSSTGANTNVNELSGMDDCNLLSEPGAVASSGGIDVAVTCGRLMTTGQLDIELVRSTDHGASFKHVSHLLDGKWAPAECGAGNNVSGPDLFFRGGVEYLIASTGMAEPMDPAAYNACLVYPFADPDAGTLQMKPDGGPVVLRRMTASDPRFFGPCSYAEGASAAGYLTTEHYLEDPPRVIRSYATGVAAP